MNASGSWNIRIHDLEASMLVMIVLAKSSVTGSMRFTYTIVSLPIFVNLQTIVKHRMVGDDCSCGVLLSFHSPFTLFGSGMF